MAGLPAGLQEAWYRWRVERNRRGLRAGLAVTITLYPAFGLLDWVMAPREALPALWGTRAAVVAVTLWLFWLLRTAAFDRYVDLVTSAYTLATGAGISMMTPYIGGLASQYYAGLSLVVLAAGLLFVWPPRLVLATHASVVLSFLAVNAAMGTVGQLSTALSNISFLSATAIIAGVGQVLYFHTQHEQLGQRLQLEETTANLERAHAELQQLDQFKTRFFANMTHELRTPLAMILAPLELLMQGELGDFTAPQKSTFATMYRSALKLLKLINDLLDLSRLEESRLRLQVGPHDLGEYLRSLVEQTQVLARRKGIELRLAAPAGGAVAWCDLERLERVFVNLLSNAVKFTPPGGHVTVSLEEGADAVRVQVRDDGPGFPPETAARLFERFYQVDMAGTRQHGGAGIGLALAREIVELHGGSIAAESDGRTGACFTVSLPRGSAHFQPDALAAGPDADGERGLDWTQQLAGRRDFRLIDIEEASERRVVERDSDEVVRPYTAVVVEDTPQVIQFIHMTLRRRFRVLAAADGLKGLEMVARELPNLVVTDLMMPGIDGLELTRRLREAPATRHIPVIMLSARGDLTDRVHGHETGVSAYLTKPFSPKELLSVARRLVQEKEKTADLVLTQRMESLEIVAAGLAHELNNPLNYVKNALARVRQDTAEALQLTAEAAAPSLAPEQRARLEKLSGRARELLDVADAGLKRIGGTVELMGRYGRAGYRRELQEHDAWAAVRTVKDVILPATGRRVEVVLELAGEGTVECVPEELNQVLSNLLQNAIEACPDPGGRVTVRGGSDAGALWLSVKDNGGGIPQEALARLFTPFFTTKGPGRGVGLGLTISRRVVQSLGGTLQAVSPPGEGAEFQVRVPRRQPRAEAAQA